MSERSCVSEQGKSGLLWTVFEGEPFCSRRIASFADEQDARNYIFVTPQRIAALEAENERLRQELAMVRETGIEATREVMGELREVAEILGGPGNTKPAIDLAREAEAESERLRQELAEVQRDCDAYKANFEESLDAIDLWRLEKAKLESALQNLLAIIHRDGGQHTSDVGLTQSVDDAHETWANLIAQAEEAANLRSALAEARVALEPFSRLLDEAEAFGRGSGFYVACSLNIKDLRAARTAFANTEAAGKRWEAMHVFCAAYRALQDYDTRWYTGGDIDDPERITGGKLQRAVERAYKVLVELEAVK